MRGHWSDCAIYRAPAYEPGPCNCGYLDLADDPGDVPVSVHIFGPRREGSFTCEMGAESLVETHEFPPDRLVMDATASNLPAPHEAVAPPTVADSVDLNDPAVAVIPKL